MSAICGKCGGEEVGYGADASCPFCRIAQLEAALPNAGKLETLADWIDVKYPNDSNPEVQSDLRRWAAAIRSAVGELPVRYSVNDGYCAHPKGDS